MSTPPAFDRMLEGLLDGKEWISVPEIQYKARVSYREARDAVEYAVRRHWLERQPTGLFYRVIRPVSGDLDQKRRDAIIAALGYQGRLVFEYLHEHLSTTLGDLQHDLDLDEKELRSILQQMEQLGVVFQLRQYYFWDLSASDYEAIRAAPPKRIFKPHFSPP